MRIDKINIQVYCLIQQNLTSMKRTHSELLLRNMATSIQNSLQRQTVGYGRLTDKGTSHVCSSTQIKISTNGQSIQNQEQRENRVFILEKQIANLERGLEGSKDAIRSYTKELDEYEVTTKKMAGVEMQMQGRKEEVGRVHERMAMLNEQIQSTEFNYSERVNEKEYYEDLVQTYHRQYQAESQALRVIIRLEVQHGVLLKQIVRLDERIASREAELREWKEETGFDLNQHRLKNNLKTVRMQLIEFEDQCDTFCQSEGLRKVRQLLCLFFKNYSKRNGIANQQVEDGLDLFICRKKLVEEVSEFIRDRLVYNKPPCKAIENYLDLLGTIQGIFLKGSTETNQKVFELQVQSVSELIVQKKEKEIIKLGIEEERKSLNKKIDDAFGLESLAVIEYLREKSKRYDIKEIKSTLKENKMEQEKRIQMIKQAYQRIEQLQTILQKDFSLFKMKNQENMLEYSEEMIIVEEQLGELRQKHDKLMLKKDRLQETINRGISRWRQRDDHKAKLKQLYQELSQTKKKAPNQSGRKESIRSMPYAKKTSHIEIPLAQSRQSKYKKITSGTISQSRSILSLKNPFEKVHKRQSPGYEPLLADCEMVFSKKLSSQQSSKRLLSQTLSKRQGSSELKDGSKKTIMSKLNNKQNDLWQNHTKCEYQTNGKYSLSIRTNNVPTTHKGKISQSQRTSLSHLLISKFNR